MAFKEKLQMEHPERITEYEDGGCVGCPSDYGYEEPKLNCDSDDKKCRECWNREMPDTEPKVEVIPQAEIDAYNQGHADGMAQGLNDAWELAKKCVDLEGRGEDNELMFKIFNTVFLKQLFNDNTPQEALAKLKAYEDSKIEVGDVVEFKGQVGVVTTVGDMFLGGIGADGIAISWIKRDCKKTGKHINLDSILEQIRG